MTVRSNNRLLRTLKNATLAGCAGAALMTGAALAQSGSTVDIDIEAQSL